MHSEEDSVRAVGEMASWSHWVKTVPWHRQASFSKQATLSWKCFVISTRMSHISPEPLSSLAHLSLAEVMTEHQQMHIFCLMSEEPGETSDLPQYCLRDSDPVISKCLWLPYLHTSSLFQNSQSEIWFGNQTQYNGAAEAKFFVKSCCLGHDTVFATYLVLMICSFPTRGANHLHLY